MEEKELEFPPGVHSFYGKMKARVSHGSAIANGYILNEKKSNLHYFYSPCHSLPIQFQSNEKFTLLVSSIPDSQISKDLIEFYFPKDGFEELAKGIFFSSTFQEIKYPDNVMQEIDKKLKKGTIFFVVGDKGTGKSHFARFLTNYLLNKCSEVNFIDVDPGQPEHVLPRTLGTTYIDAPIFHPPEIYKPYNQHAFMYGEIDVNNNSFDRYGEVLKLCHASIKEGYPTVINSLGFIARLGLDVQVMIAKEMHPHLIIHLENEPVDIFNYAIKIKVNPIKCMRSIIPQRHRELRFIERIKRNALASVQQPKKIDIRNVYFYLQRKIDPREVFTYAVGNIAFMSSCKINHKTVFGNANAPVKVAFNSPPFEVFGVCLIRAVDVETFTLYVDTPYSVGNTTALFITPEFIKSIVMDHPVYPSFHLIGVLTRPQ